MGSSTNILQAATVIEKTTQTAIGSEINCDGAEYLTVFIDYVKGDETGVLITPIVERVSGGDSYTYTIATATGGAITLTTNTITLTASASKYITFDVTGIDFMKFTAAGSNNDGTPTGTLAMSYILKG